MKRFLAMLLALAMIFSMSITAFAEGENESTTPEDGTITITNATIGETYSVYKVFDATHTTTSTGEAVAYTIQKDNQFFFYLFGDGTKDNEFLIYTESTNAVVKKGTADNTQLITHLTNMVRNGKKADGSPFATQVDPIKATTDTVTFPKLPFGYYIVLTTNGTAVTIDSNTPHVEIIDKNQTPSKSISKLVKKTADQNGTFSAAASANIGDAVTYQIKFNTTNYYGPQKIKYYQVTDKKGTGIWADYESIRVSIYDPNTKETKNLTKGYFLNQADKTNFNYDYIGDWTSGDKNEAEFYVAYVSADEFRVTIPWLDNHSITGESGKYTLNVNESGDSLFASPSEVTITYNAIIEPNATIGEAPTTTNLYNTAQATWVTQYESHSTDVARADVKVYAIGILKDDSTTHENLAGAMFRLYKDSALSEPVNVIPTNIKGIYMVDSTGRAVSEGSLMANSNETLTSARSLYSQTNVPWFDDYFTKYDDSATQENYMISEINGKFVVIGLEAGTYYLKEVEAPAGYNKLQDVLTIKVAENQDTFFIFSDNKGNVYDVQNGAGYTETIYTVSRHTVNNSKGVELPSTGGEGTAMLITIGAILACGFAVLMITQKKMSIYKD